MPDSNLRRKLSWLLAVRLVISTGLLGSGVLVQRTAPGVFDVDPFFLLIALTYALSIFYALTLTRVDRHRWLVDLQLACDAVIVSAFIHVTGGVTSYFSSMYVLPIIAASILQFRRGGMMVAVLTTVMYAGLVLGQYIGTFDLLPDHWVAESAARLPPLRVAGYTVAINVFGFFAVAWLSGSLAESLRSTDALLADASNEIASWEAWYQHVIDSLTSGLATTDYDGRVLTFNRAAEAITGHPAAQAIGRPIAHVLQVPSEFAATLETDLSAARSRRAEFLYRTGDGGQIEIGLSATHLDTPEGRAGFLFTFQDVTDIKRRERDARLQQRLAALGEMAAGIAHEIRNPLASMSGSIQILRRELPLSAEQAQLMDIVLRESGRLNDTIRSFLAYARPQRFRIARLDLRRVLNDAALLLRHSAEADDGHIIDVEPAPAEISYDADEGQIRQIVWNLATNGLRAMSQGGRLRLAARAEPSAGEQAGAVVLEVIDQGVGIPAEELDGIFQPFHGSFTRGSGLGLAIVHRIVADYGGEIQVNSTPGLGTRVTVRLPVRTAAAA